MGAAVEKRRFHIDYGPAELFERVHDKMDGATGIRVHGKHFRRQAAAAKIPKEVMDRIPDFEAGDWELKCCEVRTDTGKFVSSTWETVYNGCRFWLTIGAGNVAETIARKKSGGKDNFVTSGPLYDQAAAVNRGLLEESAGKWPGYLEETKRQCDRIKIEEAEQRRLSWEEIRTEHVVQDEWIDLRRTAYRFPDGRVSFPYYSYTRRDYVVVIALDEEGLVICVRQFRQGIRTVTTEFPAGGIERQEISGQPALRDEDIKGHPLPGAEDALRAARRELQEETGYVSDRWIHLITIPADATISDNYAYLYMAFQCRRVSGQHLDETEFVNVKMHTVREIDLLIREGGFQQAVHIMAWLLAKDKGLLEILTE